jgi:hypothetical protein
MKLRRPLVAAVLTTVLLSGCGAAAKLSPQAAIRDAATSTANAREGTFTFSLLGSEDDLNAVLNEGAALSDADRRGLRLLGASHIALSTGQDVFGLDVKAGDIDHAVEVRYVGKKLYARADVPGLVKLMEGSPDEVARTVQGLSDNGFAFLKDAAAGKWLVADLGPLGDMLKGLGEQFGGTAGTGATTPSSGPITSQFQQARDAIGKALRDGTAVDKKGSDPTGDHYLVTVRSLRQVYAALLPAMADLPLPGKAPAADKIPDRPLALDTWVKGGRVVRVELPLNQFYPGDQHGRVAVRLDISHTAGGVTAPAGAVPVDVAGLARQFIQGLSGMAGLGGAGGLAGLPGLNGTTG